TKKGLLFNPANQRKAKLLGKLRLCWEYDLFRKEVFKRDNYCCQKCSANNSIVAHHILNFSSHPDLRYEPSNGITLCDSCHKLFHSIYGITDNNDIQLKEFLADDSK